MSECVCLSVCVYLSQVGVLSKRIELVFGTGASFHLFRAAVSVLVGSCCPAVLKLYRCIIIKMFIILYYLANK